MAEESLTLACDNNDSIEYHIVTLFEKIEELRRNNCDKNLSINDDYRTHRGGVNHKSIHVELRSVEFWRSVIAECMASFFYVFIVCGAAAGSGVGASLSSVLLATALATGFAMTTLTHCFIHISGAHINPAVTLAMAVTRNVSPIRAIMFLLAQCGGSIAAAAVLYGVTVPKYTGNLSAAVAQTVHLATWERFGVEFVLTFIIVFTYFVSMDSYRKSLFNSSALTIGAAYTTCTFVSMPYLNPARSLGPSFVLNKWDNHWVYWFGPMVGGVLSGLIYEFIFHSRRRFQTQNGKSKHHHHHHHRSIDGVDESSTRSMPSCDDDDDHDNYDDLEKAANMNKYHGSQHGGASNYNTYRAAPPPTMGANINAATAGTTNGIMSTIGGINYCQNSQPYGTTNLQHQTTNHQSTTKLNRVESIYGGTKSLYCKSPPLTRANLNRSQSVYTKSNCNINLLLPRSGPLIPAQSMYPIRIVQQQPNQQSPNNQQQNQHQISSNQAHVQNQNVQNQIQQQTSSNQQQSNTNQQIQQTNQQIQQQAVVNRSSDPNYGVLPLNMQNTLARQQQQNQQQTINNNGGGSNTNYNTIEMIRPSPPPPLPPPSSSSSTSSTTITMRERERDRDASSYHHHYQHQSSHHQQASHHQPAQHHQNHHQINRTLQQQQQQQQQCNTLTLPPQYK